MKHFTPTAPTIKDAIAHIEAHGTANQKQDIRKAKVAFALHGFEAAGLNTFPVDLVTFEQKVPKLSGTMPGLQKLIHVAGLSDNTYKQSWRAARRLITEFTGAAAEKKERKGRDDAWTELQRRVGVLVSTGLLGSFSLRGLSSLTDACRVLRLAPTDLTSDTVATLLSVDGSHQRTTLRKGLKALDQLRDIPRLTDLLPALPVTPAPKKHGRLNTLPPYFQEAIPAWVARYARELAKGEQFSAQADPLSKPAQYHYSAALSLWVTTLLNSGVKLHEGTELDDLFTKDRIDTVVGLWSSKKRHADRTQFSYMLNLAAVMSRHGLIDEASYATGLTQTGTLKKGRAAAKRMSPKVKRWCEALLRDPRKTSLFQVQHIENYRIALDTIAAAKAEGFDLTDLSEPERMDSLPENKRSRAKHLLHRARLFGLLAAYAAIALEGAPYRRKNILSLRHTGPKKTIFLHLTGPNPHAIVKFPNEELKNGDSLTERGDELEAVTIEKRGSGDFGPEILKFYLHEIRPLFPEGDRTHCLFPPIKHAHTTETGFVHGTLDVWLAEGSAEIGLPLSSHNFRHGYCSIDINEGRRSMEDLAKITGDSVETIQRFYAWINARESVVAVQKDNSRRRAGILKSREGRT